MLSGGRLEARDVTFEIELSPERKLLHQPVLSGPPVHGNVALVEVVRGDPAHGVGKSPGRRDAGDGRLSIECGCGELGAKLPRERNELADG